MSLQETSRRRIALRKPRMREDTIQRAVFAQIDAFARPGVVAWHTANGGSRHVIEAAKFKRLGVRPGIPDVLLLHQGQLFALELKAERGQTSKHQKAMLAAMAEAGAKTAVAKGLDEALAQLREWNLLKHSFRGA